MNQYGVTMSASIHTVIVMVVIIIIIIIDG